MLVGTTTGVVVVVPPPPTVVVVPPIIVVDPPITVVDPLTIVVDPPTTEVDPHSTVVVGPEPPDATGGTETEPPFGHHAGAAAHVSPRLPSVTVLAGEGATTAGPCPDSSLPLKAETQKA